MQQNTLITNSDITSAIGFMLTLIGLIGTFFYVHLSTWLREVLELKAKYKLNSVGDSEPRKEGRLECKFQLRRFLNHIPLLVSIAITGFILLVCNLGSELLKSIQPEPPIASYYRTASTYFLFIYFGLTIYFLLHGYLVAFWLRKKLK